MQNHHLSAICEALDSTALPWVNTRYRENEAPKPPYICLVAGDGTSFDSDNATDSVLMDYDVELYAEERDYELEFTLERLFSTFELPFSKSVTYIDSEDLIETIYTMSVFED